MATERTRLLTLKRTLIQLELIVASMDHPSVPRSRELLSAAQALTSDLLKADKIPAAALLGARGGTETAKRGSEYFRQLAAKRKTRGGGRPRKETN
jgi:hypothetical protein